MTDQNPSPQSVVVPREALELFDRTMRDADVSFYHAARQTMHELLSAPAPSSLAGGEVRDMSGETVMGMRVAAYRHPASCPPDVDKSEWLAFFKGSPPNTYCEHWSTPGEHRTDVERLFTEADVRTIPAAPSADKLRIATDAFDAITDLGRALRSGGPDSSDLNDLSDNLDSAVNIAAEALAALKAEGA